MKKALELPKSEWEFRKMANVLVHLFPNTVILIEPDHLMVVSFIPVDERTTEVNSFMLLPSEPITEKEKAYWDLNANIFWKAINEDNEMAVLQQGSFNGFSDANMTVGSYEKLRTARRGRRGQCRGNPTALCCVRALPRRPLARWRWLLVWCVAVDCARSSAVASRPSCA